MTGPASANGNEEALVRLRHFLDGNTDERLFVYPGEHPARSTAFCYCNHSAWEMLKVWMRGALFAIVFRTPFNSLKVSLLRACGARIGSPVYISEGVWIDPVFPRLLTIEDEVLIGAGAKIVFHEFRRDEFRAGRVTLGQGSLIGGWSLLGCGIEVGRGAVVAPGAVVGRDVPAGYTAIGNPARILPIGKEKSANETASFA